MFRRKRAKTAPSGSHGTARTDSAPPSATAVEFPDAIEDEHMIEELTKSDTENAFDSLKRDFYGTDVAAAVGMAMRRSESRSRPVMPELVLQSQLYTVLNRDRTQVDRDLEKLCMLQAERRFVRFYFSLPDQVAIMEAATVLQRYDRAVQLRQQNKESACTAYELIVLKAFRQFLETNVVPLQFDGEFVRSCLSSITGVHVHHHDLKHIVAIGFLQYLPDQEYSLSVTGVGPARRDFINGWKEVLAVLKRRRFHEMAAAALLQYPLKTCTVIPRQFLLRTMVGDGTIEPHETDVGLVYRSTA